MALHQLIEKHPVSWEEVLATWQTDEKNITDWKQMGFSSWNDFRLKPILDLHLPERSWMLFTIPNPLETIPHFFGGPFKGWVQDYYEGKNLVPFEQLITFQKLSTDPIITDIVKHQPQETHLIGLYTETGDIMIVEGMHRCLAVALAQKQGSQIATRFSIALGKATNAEISQAVDGIYEEYQIPRL